jgi:hypothetical protein
MSTTEVGGNEVLATTLWDCFNALATLAREILYALASWARLSPGARSRCNPTRSIAIGFRPRTRPSSRARRRPALTRSIIRLRSSSATAGTIITTALPNGPPVSRFSRNDRNSNQAFDFNCQTGVSRVLFGAVQTYPFQKTPVAVNEMKLSDAEKNHAYFERKATAIFWPGDLPKILRDLREECNALDLNAEQILKFLLEEEVFCKAEFRFPKYPPIVRYLWGHPSSYQLAISLRGNSFLWHRTALVLHGLEQHAVAAAQIDAACLAALGSMYELDAVTTVSSTVPSHTKPFVTLPYLPWRVLSKPPRSLLTLPSAFRVFKL